MILFLLLSLSPTCCVSAVVEFLPGASTVRLTGVGLYQVTSYHW